MTSIKAVTKMTVVGLVFLLLVGCTGSGSQSRYTVSGTITDSGGIGISGVSLSFGSFGTANTDEDGKWKKDGLSGIVEITPIKALWGFEPQSRTVSKADSNVNFSGIMLYPLAVQVEGEGTVNEEIVLSAQGNEYEYGTQVKLTAVPATGWSFSHWEGDLEGSTNPAMITVDQGKTVKAIFVIEEYSLNITVEGQGTVTEEVVMAHKGVEYKHGTQVRLIAVPDAGWRFSHWEGDQEGRNNTTLIVMDSVKSVLASFVEIDYDPDSVFVPYDYPTIQQAIDAATDGQNIIVYPGRYEENLSVQGKSISLRSIDPDDTYVVETTIIDGKARDAVIRIENVGDGVSISGFTMCNGIGRSLSTVRHGGGMYVLNSSVTISNNVVENNTSRYGGGVYINNSNFPTYLATIDGNTIRENHLRESLSWGGGVYIIGGRTEILNNIISGNTASWACGGVSISEGTHLIKDNTISGNRAQLVGGLSVDYVTDALVTSNTISDNFAEGNAGGISIYRGFTVFTDNVISGNHNDDSRMSSQRGGGITISLGTHTFTGNTINDNTSGLCGGGISITDADVTMNNNTLARNETAEYGGAIHLGHSNLQMVNNGFEDNYASVCGGAVWVDAFSSLQDTDGDPIEYPDTLNTYRGNVPDDIYYE